MINSKCDKCLENGGWLMHIGSNREQNCILRHWDDKVIFWDWHWHDGSMYFDYIL